MITRDELAYLGRPPRVLIAGGGVAGLEALLALRVSLGARVDIEMLSPSPELVYNPLLTLEPFREVPLPHYDLAAIAADQDAELRIGGLASVDDFNQVAITDAGEKIAYDYLLVAIGVRRGEGLAGAINLRGSSDAAAFRRVLGELRAGTVERLAFTVPPKVAWTLAIYELAGLTARWLRAADLPAAKLTVITPESRPLRVFGPPGSESIELLMGQLGVELLTSTYAASLTKGELELVPEGRLAVDRVVSLARPEPVAIAGLPQDQDGFIPIDEYCQVRGRARVYAAGDATSFALKQGGIATQQADVAAESIAARLGAPVTPQPFRPVLRGMIGGFFLEAAATPGSGDTFTVSRRPLWLPRAKVVGRYLAPYLEGLSRSSMVEAGTGS